MVIATSTVKWPLTLGEFLALPEVKPYAEYIDGNIEPKPMPQGEHNVLQIRLGTTINQVALPQKLAHAFTELRCNIQGQSL
jgi:Uma2 family endonuclease